MKPSWGNALGEIRPGVILLLQVQRVKNGGLPYHYHMTRLFPPPCPGLALRSGGRKLRFNFQEQCTLSPSGSVITNFYLHIIHVFCFVYIRHVYILENNCCDLPKMTLLQVKDLHLLKTFLST